MTIDHDGWATTVWVDPGGTTGWSVMSVKPAVLVGNRPIERNIRYWACGDAVGNENQLASEMLELFSLWESAAVGIESFVIRKFLQHKEFLSPVRIRAKIEYGLWLMEKWEAMDDERPMGRGRRVWTQEPSLAKRTLTDDRQRDYGLWTAGLDHKRDATKHCYTFLVRAQNNPSMRAAAWPELYNKGGELRDDLPLAQKGARLY